MHPERKDNFIGFHEDVTAGKRNSRAVSCFITIRAVALEHGHTDGPVLVPHSMLSMP
jgi:hypothetical protein